MKNKLPILMAMLAILLILGTSQVYAYTITLPNTTIVDVGGLDQWLYSGNCDATESAELEWLNYYLNPITPTYTLEDFIKIEDQPTFYRVNEIDDDDEIGPYYAFSLSTSPDYFILKVGAKTSEPDHYLYRNISNTEWGVINFGNVSAPIKDIENVSHWDEAGGTPVPEPATMLLLGSGLVGLASFGRRKFKKN